MACQKQKLLGRLQKRKKGEKVNKRENIEKKAKIDKVVFDITDRRMTGTDLIDEQTTNGADRRTDDKRRQIDRQVQLQKYEVQIGLGIWGIN